MRTVQRSALCRSRGELSNAYLLAKSGFDTAENEPCKVCPLSVCSSPEVHPSSRLETLSRMPCFGRFRYYSSLSLGLLSSRVPVASELRFRSLGCDVLAALGAQGDLKTAPGSICELNCLYVSNQDYIAKCVKGFKKVKNT